MCYHLLVTVTIDTNVLFQALYSSRGASHEILRKIRHGDLTMAISVSVFEEYRDVLSREETGRILALSEDDVNAVLLFIASVGSPTQISYSWRPNLRDEADNMFVELAVASRSRYLITRNTRDFTIDADLRNDDLGVVTPSDFLRRWRVDYEE